MELALSEQLREAGNGKKLQKFAKTMDYLERAKREESAPLIEAFFQQRLVEERVIHEREQQLEIELSQQRHEGDLKEKNRLALCSTTRSEEERLKRFRKRRKLSGVKPVEPGPAAPSAIAATAAATTAAPTSGKYVPRFRLQNAEGSGQAAPPEPDRWGSRRQDDRPPQPTDRWRSDDRRPSFGGSRSSWSSSRNPPRGSER
ncbi:hypothetical protein FNV43_RR08527 [Rhamnella rubrinervis]|uniref:Uncharacterized protein n=1 Tax=Rhamnella rubrinervis TaxID=2594499 RepID=A0A8K0H8R3_9ROSA|nr:hypothetical protein FNV43_RR08527 [Rhamnella rubrinervis]